MTITFTVSAFVIPKLLKCLALLTWWWIRSDTLRSNSWVVLYLRVPNKMWSEARSTTLYISNFGASLGSMRSNVAVQNRPTTTIKVPGLSQDMDPSSTSSQNDEEKQESPCRSIALHYQRLLMLLCLPLFNWFGDHKIKALILGFECRVLVCFCRKLCH